MNKKLLKLPFLTLIGSVIIRIINYVIILIMGRGTNQWTLEMETMQFYIDLILNIFILTIIGLILRKTYDRKDFLKSANLLVIYSIVMLMIEQVTQYLGIYSVGFNLLFYLPIEIFTIITSLLARVSDVEVINWIYAIPSIFAPYLLVFFVKESKDVS